MVESVLIVAEADASASALERGLSEVNVEASVAAVTDIDSPALPIVLLAEDESDATPEEVSTAHVPATDVTDRAVATAVAAALDGDHDSDASRPPSRLETLLLSALDEFPVHLYAKDDQARHVLTSNSHVPLSDVIGRTDPALDHNPEDQRRRAIQEDLEVIETRSPLVETEEYLAGQETRHAVTTKVP